MSYPWQSFEGDGENRPLPTLSPEGMDHVTFAVSVDVDGEAFAADTVIDTTGYTDEQKRVVHDAVRQLESVVLSELLPETDQ